MASEERIPEDREIETRTYRQKRAHKAWMDEAARRGVTPTQEAADLVWELQVAYAESQPDVDGAKEDIHKTAYELAALVLAEHSWEHLTEIYRDALLEAMVDVGGDECHALVRFANVVSSALSEAHADVLKRTIRHSRAERLSDELKLAKRIQSHLLPKVIPEIRGFEFAGRVVPAAEVGGDYWSIKHYADDGVVTMKLADVSGHGVAAATLVAAVKFISGGYYRSSDSAAEVMRQTNRVLAIETPYDVLVTMVYGWLHPATCKLTIVNAGHEPAFLCRDGACIDFPPTGPVLGVTETATYDETDIQLKKGDVVFFGSDGITDAGIGEPFGLARLKRIVGASAQSSAEEIAEGVIRAVTDHAGQPRDDLSLLVTKVTCEPPETD